MQPLLAAALRRHSALRVAAITAAPLLTQQRCVAGGGVGAASRVLRQNFMNSGVGGGQSGSGYGVPQSYADTGLTTGTVGTAYLTACGRNFNVSEYMRALNAMQDKTWATAIQREVKEDQEYAKYNSEVGIDMAPFDALQRFVNEDKTFFSQLRALLEKDHGISLHFCAITAAYTRIVQKRQRKLSYVQAEEDKTVTLGDVASRTTGPKK